MSRAAAKEAGEALEEAVIEKVPGLVAVPDSEADWHDARTTASLTAGAIPLVGVCSIGPNTPVEVKGCQYRKSRGGGRTRRGRWYIKRRAHERLVENGGVYAFAVYVPRADLEVVGLRFVPARLVDEVIPSWIDVGGGRSENQVAQPTWTSLLSPELVDPAQEVRVP